VVSPILGARTRGQLEDNLAALQLKLGTDQIARLDAVSRVPLGFPHELLASPAMDMMMGGVKVERR
jgi:diketogulonate reductase-like aldo/keto reductase